MSSDVYTGVWTNWSHGKIYGATLTLSARSGNLLIAFLALFVTIVSSQLWTLLCYTIHQLRSTSKSRDKIFHQHQVILRNAATPSTAAWAFLMQSLNAFKHNRSSLLRASPFTLASTLYMIAFGLAAIFSSNISKYMGDERLVKSNVCGMWLELVDASNAYEAKINNDTYTAASYARECYSDDSHTSRCSTMPVSRISYTQDHNASCPFASGLCFYGDTAALNLTSRRINSHQDLGVNAPVQDRVEYQFSKVCAPIHTKDHVHSYIAQANETNVGVPGDFITEYGFGPPTGDGGFSYARYPESTTYIYNNRSIYSKGGYVLSSLPYWPADTTRAGWTPIPALRSADDDLSIFFLESNTIIFMEPNDDPMFSANIAVPYQNETTLYYNDYYVTAMACREQVRVCNPSTDRCTPYSGWSNTIDLLDSRHNIIDLSNQQQATVARLHSATMYTNLEAQVDRRGAGALRAVETANRNLQSKLPDNQWMIEVSSWFETALARFQLLNLEYATGPSNPQYNSYFDKQVNWTGVTNLCHTQTIRNSSTTTSFSILGMVVLFSIGGCVISLNLLASTVIGWVQQVSGRGLLKKQCWDADEVLNLHDSLSATRMQSTHGGSSYAGGAPRHQSFGRMSASSGSTINQKHVSYQAVPTTMPAEYTQHPSPHTCRDIEGSPATAVNPDYDRVQYRIGSEWKS